MSIHKFVLPNGIRVLVEPNDTVRSATIGIACRAGSSHETETEGGITHFIEHMLFKGTPTRNAKQIAEAIEERGGMLNASTDKEQTMYYCRVLNDDALLGVDVLTDMVCNSLIDSEEMEREKGVVLEEIKRMEDDPEGYVHDVHLETRWGHHPLGRPIIGTSESVSSFSRQNLKDYIARRYRGENLILAVAGNVDPEQIHRAAQERLGGLPSGGDSPKLTRPESVVKRQELRKEVEQVHFVLGGDSASIYDESRVYAISVLDSILGGGMSSRLFQEIRERRGLAYSVGSYNSSYTAGGTFNIYGGTGLATWPQVQELITAETSKLVHDGFLEGELEKAKRQISGAIVLRMEGLPSRMARMTKNELFFGRDIPIDETLAKIQAVTETQVRDEAAQIFAADRVGLTAFGPF